MWANRDAMSIPRSLPFVERPDYERLLDAEGVLNCHDMTGVLCPA